MPAGTPTSIYYFSIDIKRVVPLRRIRIMAPVEDDKATPMEIAGAIFFHYLSCIEFLLDGLAKLHSKNIGCTEK